MRYEMKTTTSAPKKLHSFHENGFEIVCGQPGVAGRCNYCILLFP